MDNNQWIADNNFSESGISIVSFYFDLFRFPAVGAVTGACGAPLPPPQETDGDARQGLRGDKGIVTEKSERDAPIDRRCGRR